MQIERTFEGWEARIRSHGAARFLPAAFLGFWLCGWAFGEVVVLAILVGFFWSAAGGGTLHPSLPTLASGAAALPVVGFLLLWVTFWTFGGLAAATAFLRLLWGEDRIVVRGDLVRVTRRAAIFSRTREIPRAGLRGLHRRPGRNSPPTLMLDTATKPVALTSLADAAELDQLEQELARELRLAPPPALSDLQAERLAAARHQLEESGRVGRWLARFIPPSTPRR